MDEENRDNELFPDTETGTAQEPPRTAPEVPAPSAAAAPPAVPETSAVAASCAVPVSSGVPAGRGLTEDDPVVEPERPETDSGGARSCGAFLKLQRERLNYSVETVFRETKIKPEIITALEAEDFSALPQPVYVIAYVKRLCRFYNVNNALAREFLDRLRKAIVFDVPEDLSKSVKGSDAGEDNLRRMRSLALAAVSVILLLVLLAGAVVTVAVINLRRSGRQMENKKEFSENTLLELQAKPKLRITEL